MVSQLLKGLTEERIVLLKRLRSVKLSLPLEGIIRLVDAEGNTVGIVLNKETLEELEEELEASDPKFLASLEKSRRSGRISGEEVKRKAGL